MSRPLRIGLIAEGPAELGPSVPYIKPEEGGKIIDRSREGALHTLIRRELNGLGYPECHFIQRHPSFKEGLKGQLHTGHGIRNPQYVAKTVV
ncbi:MAG: hypothetical protein AAF485_18205, partial [Chloroflexota bacterium]